MRLNSNAPAQDGATVTVGTPDCADDDVSAASSLSTNSNSTEEDILEKTKVEVSTSENTDRSQVREQSRPALGSPVDVHRLIYLLCCFPEGKHGACLYQERLNKIITDRSLFEFLRVFSNERQYKRTSINPFRTIQGLKLTKVGLFAEKACGSSRSVLFAQTSLMSSLVSPFKF